MKTISTDMLYKDARVALWDLLDSRGIPCVGNTTEIAWKVEDVNDEAVLAVRCTYKAKDIIDTAYMPEEATVVLEVAVPLVDVVPMLNEFSSASLRVITARKEPVA